MTNERNYSGKDRDQLQGLAEFNQVSHDFLAKRQMKCEEIKR